MLEPMLAQAQDGFSMVDMLPVAGILLIIMAVVMMGRKRRDRSAQQPTARERLEQHKQKQQVQGDLERLMVELEQLSKRFSTQLDNKSVQLERLIDQADRRINELKRLQGQAPTNEARASSQTPEPTGDNASPTEPTEPTEPANATPAAASDGEPADDADHEDEALRRSVYELADEGHAPMEIARKLHEHVGKIELMLALRRV